MSDGLKLLVELPEEAAVLPPQSCDVWVLTEGDAEWTVAFERMLHIAAAIGFLQMKRWGHQWLIVTCWFGVVAWAGYIANMTLYADVRYTGVVFPVIGWWLYDIFYITPFLALPYLHSVNREIFSD